MTYANTLKLKNKKNLFAIGDFIESIDENYGNENRNNIIDVNNQVNLYKVRLNNCNEHDIEKIQETIVAILATVHKQESAEVKRYLKYVRIAKFITSVLTIIGVFSLIAIVLVTKTIGDWIFCFISLFVGCISLRCTLVLILKEWRKEGYGAKNQRKRRIRNQTCKVDSKNW